MNTAWQAFLASQGAQFDEHHTLLTFGEPLLERTLIKHGPVITSLANQALIQVKGEDAKNFLQAQLSNDIEGVTNKTAQFAAWCDPKGQVLTVFLVFMYERDYYLSFDASLKDTILKRLQMFILRAKVELVDRTDELVQIGYGGDFGDLDLQRALDVKVKETWSASMVPAEGLRKIKVIKIPGPYHRYFLVGPESQMTQAWQKLLVNADKTNQLDWHLMDIAAGIPVMTQAVSGKFIAQMLNLDKLNAINFKKGCFPGQEIIARMHFRAKVPKRMLKLHIETDKLNIPAGETFEAFDESGKRIELENLFMRPDPIDGTLAQAVANLKTLRNAQGDLRLEDNTLITLQPLPYPVFDED